MRRALQLFALAASLLLAIALTWTGTRPAPALPGDADADERLARASDGPAELLPAAAHTPTAEAGAQPAIASGTPPDPLLHATPSPGEALRQMEWCTGQLDKDPTADFERDWRWLDPQAAAMERQQFASARAWLLQRCGPYAALQHGERRSALVRELSARARRSADLQDQLRALMHAPADAPPSAAEAQRIRQLLERALRSGRPELLRDIGRILDRGQTGRPDLLGPYTGRGAGTLFTLLACDLGMPCGTGSEVVRLNCALTGRCGYPDYETMVFDAWYGARDAERIARHRAELLRRIRAGDVAGLFDPVPLPPPPQG